MKHFNYCLLVRLFALGLMGIAAVGLVGCGGGSGTSVSQNDQTRGVTMRIFWPDSGTTRVVPAAAQSVQLELVEAVAAGQTTAPPRQIRTLNRPTGGNLSQVVFLGVTNFNVSLSGRAYADKDAQGTLLAQSSASVNLALTPSVDLTLNSTLTSISLSPNPFSVGVGGSQKINVTGKDSSGNLVPLSLSAAKWMSSDEGIARVDASGNVTGIHSGITTITYQDTESTRTATLTVTVPASQGTL